MNKEQMELYRECWLNEQIHFEDMLVILKENPDLEVYFDSADALTIGSDLATGKLKINIDGTIKLLSIDVNGFVKAA